MSTSGHGGSAREPDGRRCGEHFPRLFAAYGLRMMRWLVAPTAKSLLIYVGGVVTTIFGSWVSGKLRVYDDSRKAHLDDIKQKVLVPVRDGLLEHYGPLVSHRSHVVIDTWGVQQQKENVSVTQYPNEDGPILRKAVPNILASTDQALLIDANKETFPQNIRTNGTVLNCVGGVCQRVPRVGSETFR
jgi:hypothetical protein